MKYLFSILIISAGLITFPKAGYGQKATGGSTSSSVPDAKLEAFKTYVNQILTETIAKLQSQMKAPGYATQIWPKIDSAVAKIDLKADSVNKGLDELWTSEKANKSASKQAKISVKQAVKKAKAGISKIAVNAKQRLHSAAKSFTSTGKSNASNNNDKKSGCPDIREAENDNETQLEMGDEQQKQEGLFHTPNKNFKYVNGGSLENSYILIVTTSISERRKLVKTKCGKLVAFNSNDSIIDKSKDSSQIIKTFLKTTTTKLRLSDCSSTIQDCYTWLHSELREKENILYKGHPELVDPTIASIPLEDSIYNGSITPNCSRVQYCNLNDTLKKWLLTQMKFHRAKVRGIIAISGGPTFAFRQLVISSDQFANTISYNSRRNNEFYSKGGAANLSVGVAAKGNYFLFQGIFLQTGYISNNPTQVNWQTGMLGNNNSTSSSYALYAAGMGFDYSFRPGAQGILVEPVLNAGIYYLHGFYGNLYNELKSQISRPVEAGGFKFGVGISYRPSYLIEIRAEPIIYYNFSFGRSSEIDTRFYNPGLEVSLVLNCLKKKDIK